MRNIPVELVSDLTGNICTYIPIDIVIGMKLTFHEINSILVEKVIEPTEKDFPLTPSIYEELDNNETMKNNVPSNVLVAIAFDDIKMGSILTIQKTNSETELKGKPISKQYQILGNIYVERSFKSDELFNNVVKTNSSKI